MKKISLLFLLIFFISGCFSIEERDHLDIYTGAYPIEYVTRYLYGHNSNIRSIYPDEINIFEYELTEKQIEDYSESDLFIFNSLPKEKEYVIPMYLHNNQFRIIDAAQAVDIKHRPEELWLNPTNYLKVTKNIKEGLLELVTSHYLQNEIISKYEELKLEISSISANLRKLSQTYENNTLVLADNTFVFLENYGFEIISLADEDNISERISYEVQELIDNNIISYIIINRSKQPNDFVQNLIDENDISLLKLHNLSTILEEERRSDENYLTIMKDNLNKIEQYLKNE